MQHRLQNAMLCETKHLVAQVTMLSGTGSRVNYKPITPDPESNKALLLPFAAQLHITVPGQEQAGQWLLIRTKPPTLARKTHLLWPSDNQVVHLANSLSCVLLYV